MGSYFKCMAKAGRKSLMEELEIKRRYADLAPKYFKALNEFLESPEKSERKFALEQLGKAFTKMIPQDVTSGGKELPTPILAKVEYVSSNNSNKEDNTTKQEDQSSSRGDECQQDNKHTSILDQPSTER
jgi:hypothetical protein